MAIYHLNIKPLSRAKGHTMGDALAYETGSELKTLDGRTADFTRKSGVVDHAIIGTPHKDLQSLSDAIEMSETRKNSTVGRRFTIALPAELDSKDRWNAAKEYGEWLHKEYGLAVVVSVHEPDKGGDDRNHHAHITVSDRRALPNGKFGEKARELTCKDGKKAIDGVIRAKHNINKMREKWEEVANLYLENSGNWGVEISHKSNADRGMKEKPSTHLGRAETHQIRKSKKYRSTKTLQNEVVKEYNHKINDVTRPSKTTTREEPISESSGIVQGTRPADVELHPRPREDKGAAGKGGETPGTTNPIPGSQEWIARDRERKRKERENKFGRPLEEIKGILGSLREQIREIGDKLPKVIGRGTSLEKKNDKGMER